MISKLSILCALFSFSLALNANAQSNALQMYVKDGSSEKPRLLPYKLNSLNSAISRSNKLMSMAAEACLNVTVDDLSISIPPSIDWNFQYGWCVNPGFNVTMGSISVSGGSISVTNDQCSGRTINGGSCCWIGLRLSPANVGSTATLKWTSKIHDSSNDATSCLQATGRVVVKVGSMPIPVPPTKPTESPIVSDPLVCPGSIISVDNLSLGETLPVIGTSYDLVYHMRVEEF